MEYTHLETGEEVTVLAGSYTPLKELRLSYKGREVLCVTGVSTIEGACCGLDGKSGYAVVPGYIVNWKTRKNAEGLDISDVEPIGDDGAKREITAAINEVECVANIEFW